MYPGDRAYSPWWFRIRIVSSVFSVLSFLMFFVLACLKMDGHSAIREWSWKSIVAPTLGACLGCMTIYCIIHYYTRHAAFTYTSDAAASYLLGIKTRDLDGYHSVWVFRDVIISLGFLLLCILGLFLALQTCNNCNTPYSLLSIGSACIYFVRILHIVYVQLDGWKRMRLMITEVGKFQEFLDQHRLFNFVLPDLYSKNKETHRWVNVFCFCAIIILMTLGSIWISNKNCMQICSATYINSKYLLYGIYCVESCYFLSELYLLYLQRISGVETIENLIERLENENRQEKRKQYQLLQAERQKRQNDSTSTR